MQKTVNDNHLPLSRLFMVLVASATLLAMLSIAAVPVAGRSGPREDDLAIYFYESQGSAYSALARGDIDIILFDITSSQADNAFTDSNIVTAKVPDSGFYSFDLNNNYSISDYPGIRSPMNYTEMRQAVAFLSNKDYYVDTLLGGKAARIDQPISAAYYGWANASMSYPTYPYEYSPAGAKTMLDSKFPEGSTPNPYYDPLNPLSSPYLRQYPTDHPQKAGQDLDPLKFLVRVEHIARRESAHGVVIWMRKLGVPINEWQAWSWILWPYVGNARNYHFYTGGWSVGRFPPLSLYGLYHSDFAYPGGPNYVTGVRPGVPTHPKLDALLYNASNAVSFSDAVKYTKLAAGYMTEICVTVPLWSMVSYWSWSRNLHGMVNQQGDDIENGYTFMNAYKIDGSPIRCGTINPPSEVNIIYSGWVYDYNVLDRMNLYGGVDTSAYNVAVDQGGFVRDWETTTWNDNGETKTKVAMAFRSDGYFVKPASGDQGRNVNATHYFTSAWYYYQIGDAWDSASFFDLHHVDVTGSHTFEIYFDTYSYWNTYYAQGAILPIDSWVAYPDLVAKHTENFTNPITPGDINLSKGPFWIEHATFNGTLLTPFTDYNIVKGQLHVYSNLNNGVLEVKYWAIDDRVRVRGYTVGDLPWQVALEGAGMYYCTGLTPGVGGSATFKRNPFYYMETPLLGEVDFVREMIGGKPIGAYKVDIFDLALAAGAFGSQGTSMPSSNWLPGADVAPVYGVVDIYDEVTIAALMDHTWDHPE
jgi:hypothetical protein